MSYQQKMEKVNQLKALKQSGVGQRKPKTVILSEGQKNILYASLIDKVWAKGLFFEDAYQLIHDYYKNIIKADPPSHNKSWELARTAKDLWLTNFSLPSLENYKKEQFAKVERLEMSVIKESKKDNVDKAKVLVDVYKYKDKIAGLDESNGIDIVIGLNLPTDKILGGLEIPEDVQEAEIKEDE